MCPWYLSPPPPPPPSTQKPLACDPPPPPIFFLFTQNKAIYLLASVWKPSSRSLMWPQQIRGLKMCKLHKPQHTAVHSVYKDQLCKWGLKSLDVRLTYLLSTDKQINFANGSSDVRTNRPHFSFFVCVVTRKHSKILPEVHYFKVFPHYRRKMFS